MQTKNKAQCSTCRFEYLCRDYIYFHNGSGRHKKCNMYVKSRKVNKVIKK